VLKLRNKTSNKTQIKSVLYVSWCDFTSESSALDPAGSEPFGAWEVYSISAELFYTNCYLKLIS